MLKIKDCKDNGKTIAYISFNGRMIEWRRFRRLRRLRTFRRFRLDRIQLYLVNKDVKLGTLI